MTVYNLLRYLMRPKDSWRILVIWSFSTIKPASSFFFFFWPFQGGSAVAVLIFPMLDRANCCFLLSFLVPHHFYRCLEKLSSDGFRGGSWGGGSVESPLESKLFHFLDEFWENAGKMLKSTPPPPPHLANWTLYENSGSAPAGLVVVVFIK